MKALTLQSLSVDRAGTPLDKALLEALHAVATSVADEARGETGSVSLRLTVKALGPGEVAVKPELKRNPAKHHLATRSVHVSLRGLEVEPSKQLDFLDLEALAAEKAKAAKDGEDEEEGEPPAGLRSM